ncbi:MAG: Abi family protein [Bacteroidetes bacterium]|nr:Abi family protein [Bacteroidota bacterium]
MSKIPYSKLFHSYAEQIKLLKKRGLLIENEAKALHLLEVISYYRLSGYWYPLLDDKANHVFKQGATFETAFKLYCFDRQLRQMVLSEIEKIEVAIRAKMVYVMAEKHGPFWFQNAALFSNPVKHATSLAKIGEEFRRSDEEFILAFKNKYSEPLPPSWITMEITSFGTLSILYKNLKPGKEKREIAHHFGLADSVFETWLHSIVYLRNVCAHHTRLWNRAMSIRPQAPRNPHKQWLKQTAIHNNRTYFILSMINYLLQTVNPKNTFNERFKLLLDKYDNVDTGALGFPKGWEQEPLWEE